MTARILDVTPAEYHRDPCAVPSLNASTAKRLVNESPEHAHAFHPRLGGLLDEDSPEMRTGTLLDELLLGGNRIEVLDVADYRAAAARGLRDEAIAAGKTPIKRADYEEALVGVEVVRCKLEAKGVRLDGSSQLAVEWSESDVLCRCAMDHALLDEGMIYDLKTTGSAKRQAFARRAWDLGYDIQLAAYTRALEALRPALIGRAQFRFIVVEPRPPFSVSVFRPSGAMRELGLQRWLRAVSIWRQCLTSGRWPDYAGDRAEEEIDPPGWALAQELEQEAA